MAKIFKATTAGSLPKPSWLAETEKLWPAWKDSGDSLNEKKKESTLMWINEQEESGIEIVSEGEQFRIHFVHGFLETIEGINWEKKTQMGIRNDRYVVEVPTVTDPLINQAVFTLRKQSFSEQTRKNSPNLHCQGR